MALTPTPWRASIVVRNNLPNVWAVFSRRLFQGTTVAYCNSEEDAHLIAAAPDLEAALRDMHDLFSNLIENGEVIWRENDLDDALAVCERSGVALRKAAGDE